MGEETRMERAKAMFLKYNGSRFHMDREGDGAEYDRYHISKETEDMWVEELVASLLESKMQGREALRAYASVAELLNGGRQDEEWDACLLYPLRAERLDDVTALYMLPFSLRMAERAARKQRFSRADAAAYLHELDGYIQLVQSRVEQGALTRAADYEMQEFSDPVYIADYLNDLKEKWSRLLR